MSRSQFKGIATPKTSPARALMLPWILSLSVCAGSAVAQQIILEDDFESYPDQQSFEAVWSKDGSPMHRLDTRFGNAGHSVMLVSVLGGGTTDRWIRNLGGTYFGTDSHPLVFSFDLYLDPSGHSKLWENAWHSADVRGYSGGAYKDGDLQSLLGIGVCPAFLSDEQWYQGRVLGSSWDGTQGYLDLDMSGAPVRTPGWHHLSAVVTSDQIRFFVDETLSGFVNGELSSGINSVVIGSGISIAGYDHTMWVDNVKIEIVSAALNPLVKSRSSFEHDLDGWTLVGSGILTHQDTGGVSKGFAHFTDVSGSGGDGWLIAPPKFLGDWSALDGVGSLSWYHTILDTGGGPTFVPAGISISGPGGSAIYRSNNVLTTHWQFFSVPLDPSFWTVTGSWSALLANVTDLRIRIEGAHNGGPALDRDGVDTVFLGVSVPADFDHDGDVDADDLDVFRACATGPNMPYDPVSLPPGCTLAPDEDGRIAADLRQDGDIDQSDFGLFQRCLSGAGTPADPGCAD